MKRFLELCVDLGADKIDQRAPRLKVAIPALLYETLLFFICGHDFISEANDTKFRGIVELFVKPGGAFELNLGADCLGKFNAMLSNPSIKTTLEGSDLDGGPGVKLHASMQQPGGVRPGGAANYNLQTQALEMLVTDREGLDKQSTLQGVREQFATALAKPPAPLNAVGMATLAKMREELTPYWGEGVKKLGV